MNKELKIDPELRDLLPSLTEDEYKKLENNLLNNGYDKNFPIMEWHGFIADGHNRYDICKKHNIDFVSGILAYTKKEEVMEWMLNIQLGRRNLSPIQRIAIAEKYRPIYEKQAKENQSAGGGDRKSGSVNLPKAILPVNTSEKLASIANVSEKTYRMGAKVLNSDNENVKKRVLLGETSISGAYKEILQKKTERENNKEALKSIIAKPQIISAKSQVSDEVKKICADVKTEKTKEYLDSIWDYKISVIECMNADFNLFYDGFVSILQDMEKRVTKQEYDECITNAEIMIDKLKAAIEETKKINLKMED